LGFLSDVWNFVKGVGRVVGRIIATVWGLLLGVFDLLLGFLTWPPKKLRYQIFILSDDKGPLITDPAVLQPSIDFFVKTYKDKFNIKVIPYGKPNVQVLEEKGAWRGSRCQLRWRRFLRRVRGSWRVLREASCRVEFDPDFSHFPNFDLYCPKHDRRRWMLDWSAYRLCDNDSLCRRGA
jgi:hypothetical protein